MFKSQGRNSEAFYEVIIEIEGLQWFETLTALVTMICQSNIQGYRQADKLLDIAPTLQRILVRVTLSTDPLGKKL